MRTLWLNKLRTFNVATNIYNFAVNVVTANTNPYKKRMEKLSHMPLWTKWKRPESIPYPNTWHRFTAKSKDGKIYKIKIVDLTPDRFEECVEFMKKYFYQYEPIIKYLKLKEDEISYHNDLCEQRAVLQQHTSLLAVLDEDIPKPEIVGVHTILVVSKDDESPIDKPGNTMKIQNKIFQDLLCNHDLFEIFDTDKFIREFGLSVKSEYRGTDIGVNVVKTIEKLAKAYGIRGGILICTSPQSHSLAEQSGYKLINEIIYNEYVDEQGRMIIPVEGSRSIKLYANKFV